MKAEKKQAKILERRQRGELDEEEVTPRVSARLYHSRRAAEKPMLSRLGMSGTIVYDAPRKPTLAAAREVISPPRMKKEDQLRELNKMVDLERSRRTAAESEIAELRAKIASMRKS